MFHGMQLLRTLVGIGLFSVCSGSLARKADTKTGSESPIVAEINGQPVTDEQLTSFSAILELSEGRSPGDPDALLEEYVLTRLYKDVYTTIPQQAAHAGPPTKYPSAAQRQLLRRAFQQNAMAKIDVPRSALEEWYNTNKSQYVQPARVRAYHIFMEVSRDDESSSPDKVRQRITDVKAQADSGTSFSELAKKYSEAASSRSGGEIGYVTPAMPIGPASKPMNPLLENALFGLDAGKVSDIVQTSHGLHLLYAAEKLTTVTPTLDNLVTSGILPAAVSRDMLTSEIRRLQAASLKKHGGKIIESNAPATELTTATAAFEFNGKKFTVYDLEQMYGVRFTRQYQRVRAEPARLQELLQSVLDDEALIQSAVDAGLDKKPDMQRDLALVLERAEASKRIQTIIAEAYPVNSDRLQKLYDENREALRQPEVEGDVLVISVTQTTSPAERGRLIDRASRKAEEILKILQGNSDFEAAAAATASGESVTSVSKIARHIAGQSTGTLERAFDQAIASVTGEGELSAVTPLGDGFAIARLVKRHPGEPLAFDRVKAQLQQRAQSENETNARKEMVRQLVASGKAKILKKAEAEKSEEGKKSE